MLYTLCLVLLPLGFGFPPVLASATVQKQGLRVPASYQGNGETVKTIFQDSFQAKYAGGHDDLAPVSKSYVDQRNGWGATVVDALSTSYIMGLLDEFEELAANASKIDFSKSNTPDTVSVFETTIRYLAGLLSAYQMSNKATLLEKAVQVADKLAFAWVGNNDIPFGYIDFSNNQPTRDNSNIAEAGSLILEWGTLSQLTENTTYLQLAEKAFRRIINNNAPLPGLAAQGIDPSTGDPVGGYVTWGGGSDSYFEYLIKYARLSNTNDEVFANTWLTAADSSIRTLLKRSTVGNYSYLADYDDNDNIVYVGSHLACFYGGNWLLGGKLSNNDTIVNIALELVDACWNTYASTATGIGPESFAFQSSDPGSPAPPSSFSAFNEAHGFWISDGDYILRPEVLESNFYAWRVTGNTAYLDRAASAIKSFKTYLQVPETGGFAGLYNVSDVNSRKVDDEESFWFAEVLKYLFLTFDDPAHISLDECVFNTEAHPFKAPPAKDSYGTGVLSVKETPFKAASGALPDVSGLSSVV